MRTVYIIFSVVGWAWFAIVIALLAWRVRTERRSARARGFEVVRDNAK